MRLICGFLHLDAQAADAERLAAMIAAMIEPGLSPVVKSHVEGPVALAVLDFAFVTRSDRGTTAAVAANSTATLPQDAGGCVVAADVRLYEGASSGGDELAILDALERRGGNGLGALSGDFAVAVWNPREQSLLCARDGFGVRPLFTVDQPGKVFAFASLPRSLHAGGFVARELDTDFLLSELLMAATPMNAALFRGLGRVPPGAWLQVSAQRRASECHWRLDPATAGRSPIGPEEAAEEMAALVARAVRVRLPTTGPVAAHLSGGLDSGAINVLAARALRGSGRAVLAYPFLPTRYGDYKPEGEGAFVELLLGQEPDLVCTPVRIDAPLRFLLPNMDCDQAMPFDPGDPETRVCMAAATGGAQILLSGWGGDQGASYNGRGALAEAARRGRWRWLAREVRARSSVRGTSLAKTLRSEVLLPLFSGSLSNFVAWLRGWGPSGMDQIKHWLRPEAVAELRLEQLIPGADDVENRLMFLNGCGVPRRCEHWALTGARAGIAAGFPLLDRRVAEFAVSLPSTLFMRGGVKRRLFRDAMKGVLPERTRQSHTKQQPFPEVPLLLAMERKPLLDWVAGARLHPAVDALFNLDAIQRHLLALPEREEALRCAQQLEDDLMSQSLVRALRFAVYVQQHH